MVNLTQLKEKARLLNLQNVANDEIDLLKEYKTNVEYLDYIFTRELEIRKQRRVEKLIKLGGFPKTIFNFNNLPPVISWQIEKLLEMQWIDDNQNLFVIGECNTGKTSLISYLALKAIEKEYKAIYLRIDELLEESAKTAQLLRNSDLVVIDDIMYLPLTSERLQQLYRKIIFLNESRSIVLITNRELSGWIESSDDKHTMQTMLDRLNSNAQVLRLNKIK